MGKGKKKSLPLPEESLRLPIHAAFQIPISEPVNQVNPSCDMPLIVDTHTHLLSTFSAYRNKYKAGKYETIYDFVRGFYRQERLQNEKEPLVQKIVDVWCDAPILNSWKELADSALTEEQRQQLWGGIDYWFVIGVHPHDAKSYDDAAEAKMLEAASHPRCVGLGEMGLDYHYDNSPRVVQKDVLIRQLRIALSLKKPLTIHTREADEDILSILKEHVPRDHKIHIHCFTDSPDLAKGLLDYFPNLFIGITGVITYATNTNTSQVIRDFISSADPSSLNSRSSPSVLRILLETDAPFMTPGNLAPELLGLKAGQRLPFSHSAMIPWTAQFVANIVNDSLPSGAQQWSVADILRISHENAASMYSV